MPKKPTNSWHQYHRRARLDAILRAAGEILRELHDEVSQTELEALRQRNVTQMSKIQNAAYQCQLGGEPPRQPKASSGRR